MHGAEKMSLQSIETGTYPDMSSAKLSDLAGNAVNNWCWTAVLSSTISHHARAW
jgi:hypothetical protein